MVKSIPVVTAATPWSGDFVNLRQDVHKCRDWYVGGDGKIPHSRQTAGGTTTKKAAWGRYGTREEESLAIVTSQMEGLLDMPEFS